MQDFENLKHMLQPIQIGDYVKLYLFFDLLIHEGIFVGREYAGGFWTYYFQNFPDGITVGCGHRIEFIDEALPDDRKQIRGLQED